MPVSRSFFRMKSKTQDAGNTDPSRSPSSSRNPATTSPQQEPSRHIDYRNPQSPATPLLAGRASASTTGTLAEVPLWLAQMQPNTAVTPHQPSERHSTTLVPYDGAESRAVAESSQQPHHERQIKSDSSPWSKATGNADPRPRFADRTSLPKTRKILSLDGGGVRGLSIILILKHLMRNLNRKRGMPLQPWEEFDMIGGTSTGGIIAIMLGRLHMSLDECEEAYKEMSAKIFASTTRHAADPRRFYDFLRADGKFEVGPLEDTIRAVLDQKAMAENELLQDVDQDACKVFVCATRALNGTPVVLRSYDSPKIDPYYDNCQIWEAVRATSAASTFFDPITLGRHGEVFVDAQKLTRGHNHADEHYPGALRQNNPIVEAEIEARQEWRDEDCISISVGTGTSPGESLLGGLRDLAVRLSKIVTDTEQTHKDFLFQHRQLVEEGRFFRFNVDDGSMANIGLEEYLEAARIAANTFTYLQDFLVEQSVGKCIENLYLGGQRLGFASSQGEFAD